MEEARLAYLKTAREHAIQKDDGIGGEHGVGRIASRRRVLGKEARNLGAEGVEGGVHLGLGSAASRDGGHLRRKD